MSVPLSITLSLKDYIAANLLYQRRYWFWSGLLKVWFGGGLLFFLLMLGLTALDEPIYWKTLLIQFLAGILWGLGMAIFIPVLSLVMMRLRVKRNFEQLSLALPAKYEIGDEGFQGENEQGSSRLPWTAFSDFVQDRRVLLVRRTRSLFFVLPKSQMTDGQLQAVIAHLHKAGVPEG